MSNDYIERVIERHGVHNELDVALLRLCCEMDCTDWMNVENHLIPMAATEEAKKALREVRITMYHEEEGLCGCS